MEPHIQFNPDEVAEIERHKYFLSERAGYDVGWEAAQQDWLANYADEFRRPRTPGGEATPVGGLGMLVRRLLARAGML